MSRHFFFSCLLLSLPLFGWRDSRATAEINSQQSPDTSIAIGSIDAEADEIVLDVRRDGARLLKLSGNANVNIGDIQASGDDIKLSFSAKSKAVLRLVGKVHVRTDAIWATARSAKADFASATLDLNSGHGQPATIRTLDAEKESRIEAASIRFNALKNSIEASKETPSEIPPKPD